MQPLTLDSLIVVFRSILSVSSVTFQSFLEKKYEKYESMKSHTFSLEIFSRGKIFLFIYLFLEIYQSMISYNNVIIIKGEF